MSAVLQRRRREPDPSAARVTSASGRSAARQQANPPLAVAQTFFFCFKLEQVRPRVPGDYRPPGAGSPPVWTVHAPGPGSGEKHPLTAASGWPHAAAGSAMLAAPRAESLDHIYF